MYIKLVCIYKYNFYIEVIVLNCKCRFGEMEIYLYDK